jgi:hypothetical protein
MRSTKVPITRELVGRRHMRLIHALLAFPAAGVIGFAGQTLVKSVLPANTVITSPAAPARMRRTPPDDRDRSSEPFNRNRNAANNA